MSNLLERWLQEQRRLERPGQANEIHLRSFVNNLQETRYLVEGRRDGCHCGDKVFKTHPDALEFAKMEAGWLGAKLIDHTRL